MVSFLVLGAIPPVYAQEEVFKPTWETQRQARTFTLGIPAPRGQISDRNGEPLAVTRVSSNLGINFPTPLTFRDADAVAFARKEIALAEKLTGRRVVITDETIIRHYRNRGVMPLDVMLDLSDAEKEAVKGHGSDGLAVHPIYLRHYPNGTLAAHMIGYAGRAGRALDGPIQNNDLMWPEAEGREGLELTFNEQLTGKPGQMTYNFDAKGHKVSQKVTAAPEPGYNIVTTLDIHLQKLCEEALSKGSKRGAMVFMDPYNGDILAMASWPTFDPNEFIPVISQERFKALSDDPNFPLLPRAFRSAYPPGSTFKTFVGLSALESGKVGINSLYSGPPQIEIGNAVFRNWKKTHAGMLDFTGALEQSCNTWFIQAGIDIGSKQIIDWATKFGFGEKTGIPLRSEVEGRVPTDDYMRKVYGRKLLDGDVANLSIGQGDLLVTPLQLAHAMATFANGGILYQARLVQQVQSLDDKIVTGYEVRPLQRIEMAPANFEETKRALVEVVSGGMGTGHRAGVNNVSVGGKTGTAQWGPKERERYAAWFCGIVPMENPKYAFAVIYESDPLQSEAHGGSHAAPMIGQVLRELYKEEAKPKKRKKAKKEPVNQGDQGDAAEPSEPAESTTPAEETKPQAQPSFNPQRDGD